MRWLALVFLVGCTADSVTGLGEPPPTAPAADTTSTLELPPSDGSAQDTVPSADGSSSTDIAPAEDVGPAGDTPAAEDVPGPLDAVPSNDIDEIHDVPAPEDTPESADLSAPGDSLAPEDTAPEDIAPTEDTAPAEDTTPMEDLWESDDSSTAGDSVTTDAGTGPTDDATAPVECNTLPTTSCTVAYEVVDDSCEPVWAPQGTGCDDGDPTTVKDTCDATGGCGGLTCAGTWEDGRLVHGDAPPLVDIDPECGVLSYGRYVAEGETTPVHLLPDFSYAGYQRGGVAIPEIPAVQFVAPVEGDDRANIQAAIDAVSALPVGPDGFRGAVELDAGTYEVGDTLYIQASGVVLRGAGQGVDGTVLVATKTAQHDLIRLQGQGSGLDVVPGSEVAITSPLVPVGARSFEVASSTGFQVGDTIVIRRTPNQQWLDTLSMGQWGWTTSSYTIGHERTITAIAGSLVTVDIPLVDAIDTAFGGGTAYVGDLTGRISQCGVEDLRLVSEYDSSTDEDHGWNGVRLDRVTHSWVRRLTAVHFGYAAVTIHGESNFNSVVEVAQLDPISQVTGGRRYSFNVSDGVGNLFMRCYARDGRHNFVTGARVAGPNVWVDSLSVQNNSDEGPHHRWATGSLFDNCQSKTFNVQNRESSGTGHGWAGAQTVFWNLTATNTLRCDAPSGSMNFAVGCVGTKSEGSWAPEEPFGWFESHGVPVTPRSLYFAQLDARLGADAVAAVTIDQQLEGTIYNYLGAWQGNGLLADAEPSTSELCDGIASGSVCCAASCGTCGGTGCGGLPGGADSCCQSNIKDAAQSCAFHSAPCVIPNPDGACDGIQSGTACCPSTCSTCGGAGCSGLPGGSQSCCTGAINAAGNSCAEHLPPCVVAD